MAEKSIFSKIIDGEIPADFVHQDDVCVVIRDANPQTPVHLLAIPRKPISRIGEADEADAALLGHLLLVAREAAKSESLEEGFRIVINNGAHGGESVPHLHVHVLGGRQLNWPPG